MAQTAALEERWWKSAGIKYGKTLVGRAHLVCSWFRVCCDETRIILRGIEGIKVRALNRWRHERRERREGARRILCQTALNTRDTGRVHSNASTQHSRDRLANKDRHFDTIDVTPRFWSLHHVPSTRVYEIRRTPAQVRLLFFWYVDRFHVSEIFNVDN